MVVVPDVTKVGTTKTLIEGNADFQIGEDYQRKKKKTEIMVFDTTARNTGQGE